MTLYTKPWYYTATHILLGYIAVWYPILIIVVLLYQFAQYGLDVRVFPLEGVIRKGNSLEYTLFKVAEYCLGYGIGYLSKKYMN
jgi:hypothetical protein